MRTRWAECGRKKRYPDEPTAERKMRAEGVPLRTYECSHCDGWHITSQVALPRKVRRARIKRYQQEQRGEK